MALKPEVSYEHVLLELSVNRKDPCEIIRELISNSYDAQATLIHIYPLLQYEGFIFFDNGEGMSERPTVSEISPFQAFFSIGKSTKVYGGSIGYKCQGSKLCFASRKFTLITRCEGEDCWRSISIDNPKANLGTFNLENRKTDETPWRTIKSLFQQPDNRTNPILSSLNEDFFNNIFRTGSMIITEGLEIDNFSFYYDSDGPDPAYITDYTHSKEEWSYIRNYIRFNTRHGDTRILRAKETGFEHNQSNSFKRLPGYNENSQLKLWTKGELQLIESGFPYLDEPSDQDRIQIKSPSKVSRLNDGNFYYRAAKTFDFEGTTYSIILAVDGFRRARDKYTELNRQGTKGKRSGIRLTDQRGTFICSQGIKVCSYNELFEHSKLEKFEELSTSKGVLHYILLIDGNFSLVTDRNRLSDRAVKTLKNDLFVERIKQFLDDHTHKTTFGELLTRLKGEKEEIDRDQYVKRLDEVKNSIQYRTRFKVQTLELLKENWFFSPLEGEENWVGALYTLFAHLVPKDSPYKNLWLIPRTSSGGSGIDSVAVRYDSTELTPDTHVGLEYKFTFSPKDEFNHLLTVTNQIVCWDMEIPNDRTKIKDSYQYYGETLSDEYLDGVGYKIVNIQSYSGESFNGTVHVISLKKLLNKTFTIPDEDWITPPPKNRDSQKSNSRKKRKD